MEKPSHFGQNWGLGILVFAFLALATMVIVTNFWIKREREAPTIAVRVSIASVDNNKKITENVANDIENTLRKTAEQAYYRGCQEAQKWYNENFVTLLTILTIFGIAWPIMIALVQFRFNESELEKQEKKLNELREDQEEKLNKLRKDQEEELNKLRDATASALEISQKQTLLNLGGIIAQIASQMKTLDEKLYWSFIAFAMLYNGGSDAKSEILLIIQNGLSNLKSWQKEENKMQVISVMNGFLIQSHPIDKKTRSDVEELIRIAILKEVVKH